MRYRLSASLVLLAFATPAMAGPGDMNADRFYISASELMGKGPLAMFDKRTKPMIAAMKDAAAIAKQANAAAELRGSPLYCVPTAARKKGLSPDQITGWLGEIPASRRRDMTLSQAWRETLIRKYPCN